MSPLIGIPLIALAWIGLVAIVRWLNPPTPDDRHYDA